MQRNSSKLKKKVRNGRQEFIVEIRNTIHPLCFFVLLFECHLFSVLYYIISASRNVLLIFCLIKELFKDEAMSNLHIIKNNLHTVSDASAIFSRLPPTTPLHSKEKVNHR